MPGPDEYDHNSKESAMHVLEVRNDELMDSITRQAAEAPDSPADRGRLNDTRVALP
jgi:hypothetical protein